MRQAIVISMSVTVVLTGLVRFDLKAKDPARQESSPPAIASETKAGSGKEPAVPKESLRYDGKSFGEWRKEVETELKAERQVEAIKAFAAFAGRTLSNREKVGFIDPTIAEPILLKEVREGNRNGRLFAASALGVMGQSAETALATLVQLGKTEKDREVREAVILSVFSIDQSGQTIVSLLRELVREKDAQMLGAVLSTRTDPQMRLVTDLVRVVWENRTTIKSKQWSPKGRAVLRLLTELADSPDAAIRGVAFDQIGALQVDAREAVPALIRAFQQGTDRDRERIASALVQIGVPAKPAVPVLEKSIQQIKDKKVREGLESQLRSIGNWPQPYVGRAVE